MTDVDSLAKGHPYVAKPKAKDYGKWSLSFLVGAVVGLFCINPDAGDYGEWENKAQSVIYKYFPAFSQAGCQISLQNHGRNYWIQIDIDPKGVPADPVDATELANIHPAGVPFPSPFSSQSNNYGK